MSNNYIIENGTIVYPNDLYMKKSKYIIIENGIMKDLILDNENKDIDFNNFSNYKIIDARDEYIFPALTDLHVHLREPGFTDKEDIISGSNAAYAGGFSTICCMANTKPVVDNLDTINYIKNKAKDAKVKVLPIGACTKGLVGKEICDYGLFKDNGVIALSDDGATVGDNSIMLAVLNEAKKYSYTVITHSEDIATRNDGVINLGDISKKLGVKGNPSHSEAIMIYRDCLLADLTGCPVHISHVSTAYGVDAIKWAKDKGFPITAEACPHHLFLTDEAVLEHGTNAKMAPPLRTKTDVRILREALIDGIIDIIATDHAPHTKAEKNQDLSKAPFGIIGLETSFSLMLKMIEEERSFDLKKLIEKMSINPSKIIGKMNFDFSVGSEVNLFISSIDKTFKVNPEIFKSKAINTPFINWILPGIISERIFS